MSGYVAAERDIKAILDDFEVFCQFVENKKLKLGKNTDELGKKDCFALNVLLSRPRVKDGPKYLQGAYPTIDLLLYLSLAANLLVPVAGKNSAATVLSPSPTLEQYRALNPFTKYMLLFRTYWTLVDYCRLYDDALHFHSNAFRHLAPALEILQRSSAGAKIRAAFRCADNPRTSPIYGLFMEMGPMVHHLRDFGFWEYEETEIPQYSAPKSGVCVGSVTLTPLGIAMIRACLQRPFELYHERLDEDLAFACCNDIDLALKRLGQPKAGFMKKLKPFGKAFEPIFPAGAVDYEAVEKVLKAGQEIGPEHKGNVYIFKVMLNSKVWRRFKLSSLHTMHELNLAIQDAFNFDDDHLYAFFMDGKAWSNKAIWDPRAEDHPCADTAVIDRLKLVEGQRILYIYDYGDEIRLDVRVEEILQEEASPLRPMLIEKKGEPPEPYFEWDE